MGTYNFTIRARDNENDFSDRDFSIEVKNTKVDRLVVLGSNHLMTSTNGLDYTFRSDVNGDCIAYGNGQWIIIDREDNTSMWRSTDAVTWEKFSPIWTTNLKPDPTAGNYIDGLHYANGIWMLVSSSETTTSSLVSYAWTSVDGVTWTRKGSFEYLNHVSDLTYGSDGTWMITTWTYNTSTNAAWNRGRSYRSLDDGVTWERIYDTTVRGNNSVYANGLWMRCGANYFYSTGYKEGMSESNLSVSWNTGDDWVDSSQYERGVYRRVAYGNGVWVAIRDPYYNVSDPDYTTSTSVWSTDGFNWNDVPVASGTCGDGIDRELVFFNGRFIVFDSDAIYTSRTGKDWTQTTLASLGMLENSIGTIMDVGIRGTI